MSAVQNVFRRGATYWWRRTIACAGGGARPTTLCMSLGTHDLTVARRRGTAMTTRSEELRMNVLERAARDGLTNAQRDAIFRSEMKDYRRVLVQLQYEWAVDPKLAAITDLERDMATFEAIWSAFAKTGVVDGAPDAAYSAKHWPEFDEDHPSAVGGLLASINIRANLEAETKARLQRLGFATFPVTIAMASQLVLEDRAQATRDHRDDAPIDEDDPPSHYEHSTVAAPVTDAAAAVATVSVSSPKVMAMVVQPSHSLIRLEDIPLAWRS